MRPSLHAQLVDKAVEAAISAIEIYNKPSFRYREETYCILMLNAWELLLKARILKENKNKLRSIQVFERRLTKSGAPSKRPIPKRNRAKNEMTIGLVEALRIVRGYKSHSIDQYGIENISLLVEVRDNAIHYLNPSRGLRKRVQEIGSATLRNFANASRAWFGRDLSAYEFAIMPLAFESPLGVIQTAFSDISKGAGGRVQKLLTEAEAEFPFDPSKPFNVGVEVELKFIRKAADGAMSVRLAAPNDATAIPVTISEDEVRKRYAWTYADLVCALRKRYSNFKLDQKFHAARKLLERDNRYCLIRQLDPRNSKSAKQKFYDPNILGAFDGHYKRKAA